MSDYQDRINDAVDNAVDNINNPYLLGYIRALDKENARLTKERDDLRYEIERRIRDRDALEAKLDAALAVVEAAREWDDTPPDSAAGVAAARKLVAALATYDQERSDG